jgi:DNA-binding response OmpR family regulator
MAASTSSAGGGPAVLVVDDEADILTVVSRVLRGAGLGAITAASGREALRQLFEQRPALVILDLGLPDLDGFEVLNRIRDVTDIPVLVLTARSSDEDKIRGLGLGADDYLVKPFSNAELVARVFALLRRAPPSDDLEDRFDDGPLHIDRRAKTVHVDDDEVHLSPTDWNLLQAFVRHAGQVLSPAQLLEQAWGDPAGVGPDRVKFAVLRLRRRLGWEDPESSPIEAVRGFGYRYRRFSDRS